MSISQGIIESVHEPISWGQYSHYNPDTYGTSQSSCVINPNSYDEGFFNSLYNNHTPVVEANKVYSKYLQPDGKLYEVTVSPTGILVEQSR